MQFNNNLIIAGVIALQLASTAVMAQEEGTTHDASVSLGYVGTTGNTETQTFNSEVLYTATYSRWVHNVKFQGLASEEDEESKAERYFLEGKSDYDLGENHYLYVKGNYTDDRFSGFNYQVSVSGGYGHYFYNNDTFVLEGFGGFGYRKNDIFEGPTENEIIFSAGEGLEWNINDSTALTQSLTSEIGDELTVTRFEIGLLSNIVDRISTKIAFQARNTSSVPVGREETDTQTSISLVYEF